MIEFFGMKKLLLLFIIIMAVPAYAQEICNNGIDDDHDGFIDCYDPDCSASTSCEGFYIGNDVLCEVVPSEFPEFRMTLDFASPNQTTNNLGRMSIGDIDRDGIPEIVTMNQNTKKLFVLYGNTGQIKRELTVNFSPGWEIAIGNINNDGCAELFFQGLRNGDLYIFSYDCELNFLWERRIRSNAGSSITSGDAMEYGLADFDGDGLVELYIKDMILDAHSGTIIINTSATSNSQWTALNGGPVAVDILNDNNPNTPKSGDDNLELVVGGRIYNINLGSRAANAGTRTLVRTLTPYVTKYPYNATSVADYNLDGYLDVLISGGETIGGNNYTTIYFWDVRNDTYLKYSDPMTENFKVFDCNSNPTGQYYRYGWQYGTGRLNVADLDGDGQMNVSFISGKYLYALDHNLNPLWPKVQVNEETSGYTGCTLFDFNGDGASEIVYRDERYLYIINGTNGTIFNQQTCISRTNREYPIVADVDADGSTEICVTCSFDDNLTDEDFCNFGNIRYSHVRVFKSAAEPWVPARRLWNQHGYFNVNVNDDLTIPRRQQKHHLVWSIGNCTQGPNRPLNNFLNQSPFLNSQGCPTYAAPNIAYVDNSLTVNPPTCPNGNFTVSFQIQNLGDMDLSGNVPITFYNGDPMNASASPLATRLNTITVTVNNFRPGDILSVNNATVNGPGSSFILYIALNDAGTTLPPPIEFPNTDFIECDYTDNIISAPVVPLPVSITALKVKDNIKCIGSTSPDNGAVRAFIPVGATENITDYNFYWSIGAVAKPIASADHVGATYSNIADGTYTVYAIHKTANCSSDTVSVVVGRVDGVVSVEIFIDNGATNCDDPNGQLRAVANGGLNPTNFEYRWFEGNQIFIDPEVSINAIASGLRPGISYTVLVTDKTNGCQSIESEEVPDNTSKPVVSVNKTDLLCSTNNSGIVSASVDGGVATDYTFRWYQGNTVKPTPDFTGATWTGLSAQSYTVVAVHNTSLCISDPVTVTLTQTTPPVVTATVTANQTSCDPAQPNGSATASVDVSGTPTTTGYSFEWFTGQNTNPVNRIATTPTISGRSRSYYTVKVTDDITGCSSTAEVFINNMVTTPSLSVGVTAMSTNCNTPNGSVTVTPVPAGDYTFEWYIGTTVTATPDFTSATNTWDGLEPGSYTVRARHNINHCMTAPVTATVGDGAPPVSITVNDAVTQLPTSCDLNNGSITVNISAPENTGGFDVSWYTGHTPFTNPPLLQQTGVTSSTASNLGSGLYSVVVINRDNGCETIETVNLPFADAQELKLVSKTDVAKCSPIDEGRIEVELIPSPNPPGVFNESDYDIHLYKGTADLGRAVGDPLDGQFIQEFIGVNGTSNYPTSSNLEPGWYTLVAIAKNPLVPPCRSVPVVVEIIQVIHDPEIVALPIDANTNCEGITANGQIEINIDGGAPAGNYSIQWYEGTNTSFPALGTGTTGSTTGGGLIAQNLPPGHYTVEVTNTTGTNTNCTSTATFQVFDMTPVISIASAELDVQDRERCDVNDAYASVEGIRENGVPGNPGDYTFSWYFQNLSPLLPSGTTQTALDPGTYYVQATHLSNNCLSSLVEFEIKDMRMGTVGFDLVSFVEPTQCLKPDNVLGELHVVAYGTSPTDNYTINWYEGPDTSGPLAHPNDNGLLTGITVPAGESSVTYSVEVINNDNGCMATDNGTYTLNLLVSPVRLTASTSPLTSCAMDDGVAFATVTTPGSNDYNYQWYVGNTTTQPIPIDPAEQPKKEITGLTFGEYTVVAVDPVDAACTATTTVMIENMQVFPMVTATALAPLSNCDIARPNGVATALVDGNFTDYIFEWFAGPAATGVPFHVGSDVGNLSASEYTVRATDLVSGCSSATQITIEYMPLAVPTVDVEVLSNVTSCVTPNGALSASVGGNIADYVFDWYIGSTVKASPDFTGEIFTDLAVGTYTVTATSKVTGCVSAPVSADIIEDLAYPDFDFIIENSACSQDSQGDGIPDDMPSGGITLITRNNVSITSIVWTDSQGNTYEGPILSDIEAGTYSVTVTSDLGCATTKDVLVKTDIRPYNGISRNGDNKNYLFHINCIDEFPTNHVQIFNRAGTLVYEVEGYDNIDIYFDGRANKGIVTMGNNLPDGTYFYVIDKRDGSKPMAGYLEIIN